MGFKEGQAAVILEEGKGPHKPWQWLMWLRTVITRGFFREYMHDGTDADLQNKSVRGFIKWLGSFEVRVAPTD
jgi:hypothetical protein